MKVKDRYVSFGYLFCYFVKGIIFYFLIQNLSSQRLCQSQSSLMRPEKFSKAMLTIFSGPVENEGLVFNTPIEYCYLSP